MMPYKSEAQRAKFHAMQRRGEISPSVVKEFDQASKGLKLPRKVKKMKDEDSGNQVAPAVQAGLKSYKDLHSGRFFKNRRK